MIGIIDYGMGNIHSVQKALEFMGADTAVITDSKQLNLCDKAVLPGVGAFDDAVIELENRKLIFGILDFIKSKRVLLGICLGMQILFEESQEAREKKGLGVFKGGVKKFSPDMGIKIPQMGWNKLIKAADGCVLLDGVADKPYVYFCHSYYAEPRDESVIAATCDYGREFAAVVCRDNIYGVQFHPEKSQSVGLRMLKSFVEI